MPVLLDLFCGAGGCSVGYSRAGFDVVGVDLHAQPNYPFEFEKRDALEALACLIAGGPVCGLRLRDIDAIHASPPCQRFSAMTGCNKGHRVKHPDLVDPVRQFLKAAGKSWVIENVPGAPLEDPLLLCGSMFGLRVIRHRLFESSAYLWSPGQTCWHPQRGKVGWAGHDRGKKPGDWVSVAGSPTRRVAAAAMGIDWMNRAELAQAIPPAYTEFVGRQLLSHLEGG